MKAYVLSRLWNPSRALSRFRFVSRWDRFPPLAHALGASEDEIAKRLPGDEFIPVPD